MEKKMKTRWGLFAIVGLLVPMADGCHKHAQARQNQPAVTQLASAASQKIEAFANGRNAESQAHMTRASNGP